MRHLRIFEDFKENDYFKEISNLDFWEETGKYPLTYPHSRPSDSKKLIKMTLNEIKKIASFGREKYGNSSYNRGRLLCIFKFSIWEISVCKAEDEWFYVRVHRSNRSFKCDQIEGVEKLFQKTPWGISYKS